MPGRERKAKECGWMKEENKVQASFEPGLGQILKNMKQFLLDLIIALNTYGKYRSSKNDSKQERIGPENCVKGLCTELKLAAQVSSRPPKLNVPAKN